METTDPLILITAAAVVGIFLAPLASRQISRAATELAAQADPGTDLDLSRVRSRNRF